MKRETGQLLICYKMLRTEHSRKFTTFSEQHFKYLTQQYFGLVAEQSHLLVDQCVDLTMSFVLKKSKVRNKISKLIHSKHSLRHPYSSGGKSILKESMKILKRSKQIFYLINIWRIRGPDGKNIQMKTRKKMRNNITTVDTVPSSKNKPD